MRQLYIVNATQVVTSESHPEGLFSVVSGYPKTFDSLSYDGSEGRALEMAQSEFYSRVSAFLAANNRAMWAATLTRADGRQIMQDTRGAFPEAEPQPEPEVEAE